VEKFTAKMAALKMGDPMEEDVQIGPLATNGGQRDI